MKDMNNVCTIKTGWLTLNRKCQFKCKWCYANTAEKLTDMEYSNAILAVDSLAELGVKKLY